jgi:mono/diheme cytochrome c family protein
MVKALRITATALLMGLIASPFINAADAFKEKVWPILEKSCIECHGEKKQKGKFRIDSREALLKGGESGKSSVVEGSPEKSDLIKMIDRTHSDEDFHMPPKVEKKLTPEQVKVIAEWIKAGLPWSK